jgi:uncharacterized protein (DUF2252 family)
MTSIKESVRAYEARLRKALGREIVAKDLARKHEKLAESPFVFLRGTYWRWAETILEVCPDLRGAAPVLAVGDIHLENFGTWRDVDGRLVWGVNDFDEAAEMPYALDVVRLATSALLAIPDRGPARGAGRSPEPGMTAAAVCAAVLDGYRQGLDAPNAIVLDRDWHWLRALLAVSDKQRAKFWSKIEAAKPEPAPARYKRVLAAAMPQPRLATKTSRRTAGTGSLGRPRWIGVAEWRGTPVVRELKVVLASAWHQGPAGSGQAIRCSEIANGRYRANDPWYRLDGNLLVRRLSPNNRKVEADAESGGVSLITPDMLRAMGLDLASVHLGTGNRRAAILRDLERREADWLRTNAKRAAAAVTRDYEAWKAIG